MTHLLRSLPLLASCALVACGSESSDAEGSAKFRCGQERQVPNEGWEHVADGSPLEYVANPPASGPHYPTWAKYAEYSLAVPRGHWVHNLEHGAVVLLYRPDAASETIDALRASYAALAPEPACGHSRTLLTADPEMPHEVAFVAADVVLEPSCVDEGDVESFVTRHRGHAPEDVCSDGAFVTGAK